MTWTQILNLLGGVFTALTVAAMVLDKLIPLLQVQADSTKSPTDNKVVKGLQTAAAYVAILLAVLRAILPSLDVQRHLDNRPATPPEAP